jgi:carboxypeptidase C (cathepsin A)
MIDPIGTGVSHAVCGGTDQEFWSVDADVDSVSRFIVQYLSAHNRWTSPKYIIGESYGTTRAAAVVDYLRANDGVTFNGVVFVSIATDMELIPMGPPRNELSYTVLLPSYAAVAWYHHKVADQPPALVPFLNEVRRYAAGPFTAALLKGDALSDEERDAVAEQVHKYTGLSVEYLEKVNLRVPVMAFAHEFLEGEHETVGRLDGRFVGPTLDPLQSAADYDPALGTINPVYSAAFQDYYHRELNFGIGQNYQVWNVVAGNNWNMAHKPIDGSGDTQTVVNSGVDLAQALVQEPNLRVLVLSGYFDLGSPFMAAEYMVSHLGVPKEAASRVQIKYYEAGHMMYVNPPSLEKIKRDLDGFVEATH